MLKDKSTYLRPPSQLVRVGPSLDELLQSEHPTSFMIIFNVSFADQLETSVVRRVGVVVVAVHPVQGSKRSVGDDFGTILLCQAYGHRPRSLLSEVSAGHSNSRHSWFC